MGISAGIDDQPLGPTARLLNPGHKVALMIALAEFHLKAQPEGMGPAQILDIAQRLVPVQLGLPGPQHVEVGAVENADDGGCGHDPTQVRRAFTMAGL